MLTYYFDSVETDNWLQKDFESDEAAVEHGKKLDWCAVVYRGTTPDEKSFTVLWESKAEHAMTFTLPF